jgi:outer membrane murein-binding lipoprotein Lpp
MTMIRFRFLLLVASGLLVFSGCGGADVAELTAENQRLKSQVAELESANAALQAQLTTAKADLARMNEIRQGYEAARTDLQKNLAQLAPVLGLTGSPLPPFEQLKDSSWVSRFVPNPEAISGLKELEQQFRGLLDAVGTPPGLKPQPED